MFQKNAPKRNVSLSLHHDSNTNNAEGGGQRRPRELFFLPRNIEYPEVDRRLKEIMKNNGILNINNVSYQTDITDMEYMEELGNGTCGHVIKMRHKPSGEIVAVKQMRRSGNSEDNKRIIMDIEVILKSHDCQYIVKCFGCFITDSEVWICMELMTTCFDKLLKRLGRPIPERILGKVTVATVEALSYLKDKHGVIHRDVKPSNILVDNSGWIKLCDFGISGRLKDSMAQTRSTGCAAYLAPERIEPDPKNPDYDIRADIWSLGISLVELATGTFPYQDCNTDFEVLTKVIGQDPPSLPDTFSFEFRDFIRTCLIKDYKQRPKYAKLKSHTFIQKYKTEGIDVGHWVIDALQECDNSSKSAGASEPALNKKLPSPAPIHVSPVVDCEPSSSSNLSLPVKSSPARSNGIIENLKKFVRIATTTDESSSTIPTKQNVTDGVGADQLRSTHLSRFSSFHTGRNDGPPPTSSSPVHWSSSICSVTSSSPSGRSRHQHSSLRNYTLQRQPPLPPPLPPPPPPPSSTLYTKRLESTPSAASYRRPQPLAHQPGDNRWRSASSSPLPLRNNQQNSCEDLYTHEKYSSYNPIVWQRFFHQQRQQQLAKDTGTYSKSPISYRRLQSESETRSNLRHQSPDPPPRLHRMLNGESGSMSSSRQLMFSASHSINASKRVMPSNTLVTSSRRFSDTNSPFSSQYKTRFQCTPELPRRNFLMKDNNL